MKKLLFLDFDGVLHADGDPDGEFSKLACLERYLAQMADLEIVVSSSWRESRSLDALRDLFPQHLRQRIVGTTPILACSFDVGGRQREIEAYLQMLAANELDAAWIALDDMAEFFDHACPNLILVDLTRGFCDEEGGRLLDWYRSLAA